MATAREIPLRAFNQQFTIQLNGVTYTLLVYWSPAANCWILDVLDASGQNPIVRGLALVTAADLLAQYGYLNFGFQLIVQSDFAKNAVPTFQNLGTTGHLYLVQ